MSELDVIRDNALGLAQTRKKKDENAEENVLNEEGSL